MTERYIAAIIIIFLVMMGVTTAYDSYNKRTCRAELVKAGKSVDDITKLCR